MVVIFNDSDDIESVTRKKRNGTVRTQVIKKQKNFEIAIQAGRTYEHLCNTRKVAIRKLQRIRTDAGGSASVAKVLYAAVNRIRFPNTWNETTVGDPFHKLRDFGIDICLNGRQVSIRDMKHAQTYEDDCFFSKTYSLIGDLLEDTGTPNPFVVFERRPKSIWKHLFGTEYSPCEGECQLVQKELARLRLQDEFPNTLPFRLLGGDSTLPVPITVVTKKFVAGVVRRTISLTRLPRKLHVKNVNHTRIDEWTSARKSDLHFFVYNTALSTFRGRNIFYGERYPTSRKKLFNRHLHAELPKLGDSGLEWLRGLVKRLDEAGLTLLEMCYGFSRNLDYVRPLLDNCDVGKPMDELRQIE